MRNLQPSFYHAQRNSLLCLKAHQIVTLPTTEVGNYLPQTLLIATETTTVQGPFSFQLPFMPVKEHSKGRPRKTAFLPL